MSWVVRDLVVIFPSPDRSMFWKAVFSDSVKCLVGWLLVVQPVFFFDSKFETSARPSPGCAEALNNAHSNRHGSLPKATLLSTLHAKLIELNGGSDSQ